MPLTSVRVLDLTRLLPGPYCTMLLADFGAEVIKIEEPNVGDYARADLPKIDEDSVFFHAVNRNKKSVCLDLKSTEGKENFLKLVKESDVVVESFRPGVMKRLGIDYETLKEINPRIVFCAITGYGQTGPYVDRPGHDVNYISYAGLLNMMGERNGKPLIPAAQIADIGGGALPATIGILVALMGREKTGKGQMIDISMMDNVISWLPTLLPGYLATNKQPERGNIGLSGRLACYEVYQTKDEKWMSVGALELKFWDAFCKTIGREDFISNLEAPTNVQDEMKVEIQKIIAQKTLDDWMDIFSDVDSCVAPIYSFEEMINDPQVQARDMIKNVNHSELGTMKQVGIPIKLSETPGEIRKQAPKLGEHTDEILGEIGISK
ncbi:CoA transferase [Oceanobacillus piezotolerans]|uniref:CoA transferase n=1 Tax=Oceanobacillus piezotolerans TaxID=2448030 RepID=A0A498D810_9BACI|nr:CaiB/BaiF CoA-transferase family protein [Oceanobacillus piezotolerans]RLL46845.1 CoA transferase [Oceanobacillus piezotolerans]